MVHQLIVLIHTHIICTIIAKKRDKNIVQVPKIGNVQAEIVRYKMPEKETFT